MVSVSSIEVAVAFLVWAIRPFTVDTGPSIRSSTAM
ncbi:Uncharacterised protein [Mycobacteroides abscessus subsp. abscessus]|nr:Uncharacterised protein [Mycobacteroides abscessus subsp. abscessus]